MDLLRKVPGIKFGPDVVTWPALVTAFATAKEAFKYGDDWHTQCALTLESSEFGNLVNPQDREMLDLLITLWDSRTGGFRKVTKGSGSDLVENPWINMIACTTPSWIAGNFPEYVIGGGFTSRCLFVYTDKKEKFVAYPSLAVPPDLQSKAAKLTADLAHIAGSLVGPYVLSADAVEWGEIWYRHHYEHPPDGLSDDRFGGYLARKQTHIHKLAMVLAAGSRDSMVIEANDLSLADTMISQLEPDMPKVFAKIGRTEESVQAERFIQFIRTTGPVPYAEAYRYIHLHFPNFRGFEDMLNGALRAEILELVPGSTGFMIKAKV